MKYLTSWYNHKNYHLDSVNGKYRGFTRFELLLSLARIQQYLLHFDQILSFERLCLARVRDYHPIASTEWAEVLSEFELLLC